MHAHAQIQYQDGQVESLVGFNPADEDDVKFIHNLLDEYLEYLRNKLKDNPQGFNCPDDKDKLPLNRFIVFGNMHE